MDFKKILEAVAEFYNIEIKEICGVRKTQDLVKARQIVCYLARKELNKSFPFIGKKIGGRNHTTVLYAVKKIALNIHENENLSHELDDILKLIKGDSGHIKKYFEKKKLDRKETKRKNLTADLEKLSNYNFSAERLERQGEILNRYREGLPFAEIAKKYYLTRERIRQITENALLYKVRELLDSGIEIDPEEFLRKERRKHLLKMKKRKGIPKKQTVVKKEKKWSKYYAYCRKCATKTIKHKSYGYCRRCYPRTEIFKSMQKDSRLRNIRKRRERTQRYYKEYYKRPEIIERLKIRSDQKFFGGNREKALIRGKERCQFCGISRAESYKKYGKDLFVLHIESRKDNRLENLMVLCGKCFSSTVIRRANKK